MIVGISVPLSIDATFAMVSGAADASYGVANLADPKTIQTPFRADAPGAVTVSFLFPETRDVEFVGLCRHNHAGGETWQIELFDDAGLASGVYDSGAVGITSVATGQFPPTEPHRLPDGPLSIRGGKITLSAQAAAWQIGAIVAGPFWVVSMHDARSLGQTARDGQG